MCGLIRHFCQPRFYQFSMANNSLVNTAQRLQIGNLTTLSTLFVFLLKSICEKRDAFCQQTRMLTRQKVNNDVSKDSPIAFEAGHSA